MQVGPKVKFWPAKSRVVRDEAGVTANYKIRPRLYFASSVFCIVLYFQVYFLVGHFLICAVFCV